MRGTHPKGKKSHCNQHHDHSPAKTAGTGSHRRSLSSRHFSTCATTSGSFGFRRARKKGPPKRACGRGLNYYWAPVLVFTATGATVRTDCNRVM
jgi:hypothetical protein